MLSKLRPRTTKVKPDSYNTELQALQDPIFNDHASSTPHPQVENDHASAPPVYTIDLSLPPQERYVQVAKDFQRILHGLPVLFNDICDQTRIPQGLIHFLARLFLHRVHSTEQTAELRGFSNTLKLPMYLLVVYNVLLDLLMGCTSGGALVRASEMASMMHFRALDWGQPELRDALVQYEFVQRPGGKVVASTISYVGFVGVLTGVRKDLSVSLNFRPYHNDDKSVLSNAKFLAQQLAVLLGFRPSIASVLRDFIVPRTTDRTCAGLGRVSSREPQTTYGRADIYATLPTMRTTAGYLIFCTGAATIVLEKDRKTAAILHAPDFITVTNHDFQHAATAHANNAFLAIGMQDLLEESVDRKKCLADKWDAWQRKKRGVPLEELKQWMLAYPTCNEQTHFVCVMDPGVGGVRWVRGFAEGEIRGQGEGGEEEEG